MSGTRRFALDSDDVERLRTGSARRIRVEYIRIHTPGWPIRVLSA